MQTGTIARLLIDKGFGFIRDEGGTEHFFHRSSVRGAVFELLARRPARRVHGRGFGQGSARRRGAADRELTPAIDALRSPGRSPRDGIPATGLSPRITARSSPSSEANGARWPSRSSKPVAARARGGLGSTPRRFRHGRTCAAMRKCLGVSPTASAFGLAYWGQLPGARALTGDSAGATASEKDSVSAFGLNLRAQHPHRARRLGAGCTSQLGDSVSPFRPQPSAGATASERDSVSAFGLNLRAQHPHRARRLDAGCTSQLGDSVSAFRPQPSAGATASGKALGFGLRPQPSAQHPHRARRLGFGLRPQPSGAVSTSQLATRFRPSASTFGASIHITTRRLGFGLWPQPSERGNARETRVGQRSETCGHRLCRLRR